MIPACYGIRDVPSRVSCAAASFAAASAVAGKSYSATDDARLRPTRVSPRIVRRQLAGLGVRDADLPDLCQEVFLVVHGKGDVLPAVDRVDLWLREICRRVAAGYRRRAGHRLEVLGCDDRRSAPIPARRGRRGARLAAQAVPAAPGAEPPRRRIARSARAARRRRDAAQRAREAGRARSQDGPQPAGARAPSGVALAVRRWRCRGGPAARHRGRGSRRPASPFMRDQAARGRIAGCAASELEILRVSPELCSGALGNVTVSDWRGPRIEAATDRGGDRAGAVHAREVRRGDRLPRAHRADDAAADARGAPEDRRRAGDRGSVLQQLRGRAAGRERAHQPPDSRGAHAARPSALPDALLFLRARRRPPGCVETTARGSAGPLAPDELVAAAERVRGLDADRDDERATSGPSAPSRPERSKASVANASCVMNAAGR